MKLLCNYILLLFGLIYPVLCFPYANKPQVVNIPRQTYGAENKNWAVAQDDKGVVYFGNDGGLLEFDGMTWKVYTAPNDQVVRSLYVVSNETIFSGGYEEFGRWDRDVSGDLKYTSLSTDIQKSHFNNGDFWKIIEVDSLIYFQSFQSLFVYDHKTVEKVEGIKSFLLLSKVRGEIYFQSMRSGLYRIINGTQFEKIEGSEFFSDTDVRVFLPLGEDKMIVGTNTKGLYLYDGEKFEEWNSELSRTLIPTDLNCGLLSSKGTYYFGTLKNGIYEVNKNGKIIGHISADSNLQDNSILSLAEDNTGSIWAGLDRGISYIDYEDNISFYTDPTGNTGAIYDGVEWNGKLVLATNQGAYYLDIGATAHTNTLPALKVINNTRGQVWTLDVIDGELYCGDDKGLRRINKDLTVTKLADYGGVYSVRKANLHNKDVLLLSTYYGLEVFDLSTNKEYPFVDLFEPIINTEIDHLDNIWLEHANKGVYRTRLGSGLDSYSTLSYYGGVSGDGLPYKLRLFKVGGRIELMGDSKFFTYDDIHDKIVENIRLNDCFASVTDLRHIIHHTGNYYWALGKTTVYLFFYDGYNASIIDSYDVNKHGLSLVNVYEKVAKLSDNVSLICLDNGFFLYDLTGLEAKSNQSLPVPYFRTIESSDIKGNKEYVDSQAKHTKIDYSHNTISFTFTSPEAFSSNLSFSYKLQGVDGKWIEDQKMNKVFYPRLPSGTYQFMVRAKDPLGNLSEVTMFEFTILKPWYSTYWAFLLYTLAIVGLLYLVWMIILRRYRNLHLQKIRQRETRRLHALTKDLQEEVDLKKAEMLTQASFIIQKNKIIQTVKDVVDEFYAESSIKAIIPLQHKISALLNKSINSEEDWKMFLIKFEEKHTGFFKKIKKLYPELTAGDLRLCACLKLNLETKEIASLMNLSVRAVENNRYRLRKKMNLDANQNLNEFILSID